MRQPRFITANKHCRANSEIDRGSVSKCTNDDRTLVLFCVKQSDSTNRKKTNQEYYVLGNRKPMKRIKIPTFPGELTV